jgi:hypothetical protein
MSVMKRMGPAPAEVALTPLMKGIKLTLVAGAMYLIKKGTGLTLAERALAPVTKTMRPVPV